jgi:hypothetical protein
MRLTVFLSALALAAPPALAVESLTPAQPTAPRQGAASSGGGGTIAQLLAESYEIKAAFVNANTSYVFLQKGTSAFMCKSVAGALCEKLN